MIGHLGFSNLVYSGSAWKKEEFPHSDDAFLLHPTRSVMKLDELHCHLVVDGHEELFPFFEFPLQVSALFVRQLWRC